MRKLIIFTFIIFLFTSCEKTVFWTKATIIDYDYGMCMCCGGVFIEINNDTFRTDLPIDFEIETFPLDVKIQYDDEVSSCNSINLYDIKLQ